jgi:3-methylcrotonyl-CoA carboxylase alpha subunit
MQGALAQTEVVGVKTNLGFLQTLVQHPAFLSGHTDTSFIALHRETLMKPVAVSDLMLAAACARVLDDELPAVDSDPWTQRSGWRMNGFASRLIEFKMDGLEEPIECHVDIDGGNLRFRRGKNGAQSFAWLQRDDGTLKVRLGDEKSATRVLRAGEAITVITAESRAHFTLFDPFHFEQEDTGATGRLTSMMPGRVVKLIAKAGDVVKKGQPLIILEAMKMEHTIVSPQDGTLSEARFKENDLVPADAVLFAFEE